MRLLTVWLVIGLFGLAAVPIQADQNFEAFAQQYREQFQQFRDERDRQFHRFLQKTWEEFRVFQGEVEDPAPKPQTIPLPSQRNELPRQQIPIKAAPTVKPAVKPQPAETKQPDVTERSSAKTPPKPEWTPAQPTVTVDLLGQSLGFALSDRWHKLTLSSVSADGIAAFWADFAKLRTQTLLADMQGYRHAMHLNDWGMLVMARRLGQSLYSDANLAELVAWGLLLKAGYDVRAGYHQQRVYVLFNARQAVFDVPYFKLAGQRYYLASPRPESGLRLHSYAADYPGATAALDLSLSRMPVVKAESDKQVIRHLKFEFQGQQYQLQVPLAKELITYLASMPQLALQAYFVAAPSAEAGQAVVTPLRRAAASMSSREAVNFLLRFVQTAFAYQTDQEQFGSENYLFIDETLFYPAADCEDRSLLFAWLIRQVLDLDVVALDYPGHVATAVALDGSGPGLYVEWQGRRHALADPTYINAGLGRVVPPYADKQPTILQVTF